MSLNNLCLPPQLMVELYGRVLIDGHVQTIAIPTAVSFEGGNEKNVLIVVKEAGGGILSKANKDFLEKVLSGCSLILNDVAVINSHGLEATAAELHQQFSPQKILLLNADPKLLSLPNADVYVVSKADGVEYLLAPSLDTVQASQEEKRKLWAALKQLFCL